MSREVTQDSIAEQTVLFNLLVDPDVIIDIADLLQPHHFAEPRNEILYETVIELRNRGEGFDPVSLVTELGEKGNLQRAGGIEYITSLLSPGNIASYGSDPIGSARSIWNNHKRRRLEEAAKTIAEASQLGNGNSADEALEIAEAAIYDISTSEAVGADVYTVSDLYSTAIEDIKEAAARPEGVVSGLMTGFDMFDELTGGLKGGQLLILAARPGIGKTTLAIDFARNASFNQGKTILFFSLEMGRKELNEKILSAESRVELKNLQRGKLSEEDWHNIHEAKDKLNQGSFIIDDNPETTLSRIRSMVQRQMLRPEGCDLVIIDYLQLMTIDASSARLPRQEQVSAISRGLKLTAKEFKVTILVLAQLNRKSEERADRVPQVSDLRESGSLEQDADMVLLINRPESGDSNNRPGEADLIVGKHRNGPTGKIPLTALLQFSKFVQGTGAIEREDEQIGDGTPGGAYEATSADAPW